jgi:hypothetical protein
MVPIFHILDVRDAAMTEKEAKAETTSARPDERRPRPPYQAPRIVKKRAVSRATLFTGGGPNAGGVVG